MTNNKPNIHIPGSASIDFSTQPAPNADAVSLSLQGPSGAQTFIYGGMTKLELVSMHIYASNVPRFISEQEAVEQAVKLLQCCREHQIEENAQYPGVKTETSEN